MKQNRIQLPAEADTAIRRLEGAGYEAWVVGGCVRDSLLGRTPNDWDIATAALPEQIAETFSDCRLIETGRVHGTITVLIDGVPLEITTYRNDGEYADHRHPIRVTFSKTLSEDLSRRDFTVNAMAYHPARGIADPFDGRTDLSRRVIRCVGEPTRRFDEDGLRILRAVRFSSVLGFSVEEQTALAVHQSANLLSCIAPERIREEFCKLLCGAAATPVLREFADVISVFLPEIQSCIGFEQNSKYHCYDVYEHTLQSLSYAPTDLIVRLTVFFHDIGKPQCYTEDENGGHFRGHGAVGAQLAEQILHRLRFDRNTTERVTALVTVHDQPLSAEPRSLKRLMRKFSDEDILRLLEVQRCDRLAHAEGYNCPPKVLEEIPDALRKLREADACLSVKDLCVNGNDLMALGIPAGRRIGTLLNALLEEVLEERLPNEREALLHTVQQWIRNHPESEGEGARKPEPNR